MIQPENHGARRLVLAGLAAVTFAVLFYLRDAQQIHDSMSYAVSIKTGWRLFHPHHLLFGPIVRALWLPMASVVDAVGAAQIHNAIWAAIAVTSGCTLLLRATGSLALGAAAGLLLIATYGFLLFGVQVEVYVPAAACFTLAILVLSREPTIARLAAAALFLALSIFYHQPNVLLCLPLGAFLVVRSGARGLRSALAVIGTAGAVVLGTYVAVYAAETGPASVSGFIDFTLRYAVGEDQNARDWGASGNVSLLGLATMLTSQLSTLVMLDDGSIAGAARLLGIGSALLMAWSVWRIFRDRASAGVRGLLLGWWIVNDLFYLWWQPGQREFFVAPLVPIVLLSLLAVGDLLRTPALRRGSGVLIGTVAIALLVFNVRHIHASMAQTSRAAAAAYLQLAPQDAYHLSYRNAIQELRYSFDIPLDRSANLTIAKRRLFTGIGMETLASLPRDGQVVVPGAETLPSRKNSVGRAPGWMRYYTWLFRLEFEAEGLTGPVQGPSVELVADGDGPYFLIQGPADVTYPDLPAFFRALDAAFVATGRRAAFEAWFAAHRADLLAGDE